MSRALWLSGRRRGVFGVCERRRWSFPAAPVLTKPGLAAAISPGMALATFELLLLSFLFIFSASKKAQAIFASSRAFQLYFSFLLFSSAAVGGRRRTGKQQEWGATRGDEISQEMDGR